MSGGNQDGTGRNIRESGGLDRLGVSLYREREEESIDDVN